MSAQGESQAAGAAGRAAGCESAGRDARAAGREAAREVRTAGRQAAREVHPIEPVYDEHSRVLLLGSFPSPKSREVGFYYGHPRNRMWRVLAEVCGCGASLPETTSERREFLLAHGIAMHDVASSCEIVGASDASIRDVEPADLSPIFATARIEAVFATGSRAAELYEKLQLPLTGVPAMRLPSTSPANAAMSLDALVEVYRTALGLYLAPLVA